MYECFDTGGEKIRRIGVASVKRVLKKLVNITDDGEDCWATVSCPDAGVFIARLDNTYCVSKIMDADGTVDDSELYPQLKAINKFLELRQKAKECSE